MAKTREITGAAALAGVAAIGGKVAWDRLSGSRKDLEQAFRIHQGEPVPDGIRRIARGQLDHAHSDLQGASKRKLPVAVHETRKSLKRLRATVRLARGALGDAVYRRENVAFRETGQRLSRARDATVLIDALAGLEERAGSELPPGATANLRARLEEERDQALASLSQDDGGIGAVLGELEEARPRTAAWTFEREGFDALGPGLTRIYSRGRKAMQRAGAEPSNENFHEWRKRVKDLWHAVQILRPANPKKMSKLAKRIHGLSDLLGDDHDLAELHNYATRHPPYFDDRVAQDALLAVIARRRKDLQRQALKLGSKLYARPPKRFVKAIERRWNKNAQLVAT
jgi:CHAD domain-containing protein